MHAQQSGTVPTASLRWFDGIGLHDSPEAGGKGANLGELTAAGFPVPPGFVVTATAYRHALAAAGAAAPLEVLLATVDADDPASLAATAAQAQRLLHDVELPGPLLADLDAALGRLGPGTPLAVRSSATDEDAADASFAGMNATWTNVVGIDAVVDAVRGCWASLHGERAIAYRAAHGGAAGRAEPPAIAVIVQQMVPADCSGTVFTADPRTGDRGRLTVEAVLGQGEAVVSGAVQPDTYVVRRSDRAVLEIRVGHQDHAVVAAPGGGDERRPLGPADADRQVLSDAMITRLAGTAEAIERHYGRPQDIEWVLTGDRIWIVQSRPITTLPPATSSAPDRAPGRAAPAAGEVLLRGLPAAGGRATGRVRVVHTPEASTGLGAGDVLVAPMTSPDWVPAMRRVAALVTDEGGMTCHAAVVARELGLPCVVGTGHATTTLSEGVAVTVDGDAGMVTTAVAPPVVTAASATPSRSRVATAPAGGTDVVTGTRVYVNLSDPDRAGEVAALPADGVGLLRAELMVTEALGGVHPQLLLERGEHAAFVERMAAALERITRAFAPRPVVYRSLDLRTNEFRHLEGGDRFEPEERNPMIGDRGCHRYRTRPELFGLELDVLGVVAARTPNLRLMLPFVRTGSELAACLELVHRHPVAGRLPVWVMAEVPSVGYWLPHYAALGVSGVSIGSNDLTQLVLGVDRDNAVCADVFDERDPAVIDVIERIVAAAQQAGISSSLCGQAPSVHPDYAEHLVRLGITSVSVEPAALAGVRATVAAAERAILLEAADLHPRAGGLTAADVR